MTIWELILLALIQGITEFLPVSSSAHLILTPILLGWPEEQGVLIDVMAHFGSLFAVMLYFRRDVADMFIGLKDLLARKMNRNAHLALSLIIATPPALIAGFLLHETGWDTKMRAVPVIAITSIVFGLALWWADVVGPRQRQIDDITTKDALYLGLAQAVALIPGTSRSGITMTAGRMMALTRVEAAHFSMLMSIPIIGVGGVFALYELTKAPPGSASNLSAGLIVALFSFVAAYVTISYFMKLVSRIGMFPFMVYRVILGVALLLWFWLHHSGAAGL